MSYARELLGDVAGAIRSMEVARDVAGSAADLAWTSFHLGELRFNMGDVSGAAKEYRAGMQADPDFVPNLAGLGKVAWADGRSWTPRSTVRRGDSALPVTRLRRSTLG